MTEFGELVLVLGDLYIPSRCSALPPEFAELLVPGKMQHVLCTGNACSKTTKDYLHTLAQEVHMVRGDFDQASIASTLPDHKILQIGAFRLLLLHGHTVLPYSDAESLAALHRQHNADIIVTGGPHHVNEVYELHGRYVVNPGSCTGAYSTLAPPLPVAQTSADNNNATDSVDAAASTANGTKALTSSSASDAASAAAATFASVLTSSSGEQYASIPSFILMAIKGSSVTAYVYELRSGQVAVSKSSWNKAV